MTFGQVLAVCIAVGVFVGAVATLYLRSIEDADPLSRPRRQR